ncbi:PilN domain-containing protein [Winogradskyella sp.]|uniref:PilN domain-containing protein n=1 Tax=Winogradskyella sp. TaxID=1883156 RepID=UPI003BA9AC95
MIKKLINTIKESKTFYVLGVNTNDGTADYHLMEFLFKDQEIHILNRQNFSKLDASTSKYLKKNYPIIVHIDGDTVISKDVQHTVGYRNGLIFKSNPDDFYFYEYHQDQSIFASLTRKAAITELLAQINALDRYVVHMALGPFVLINLQLALKNESVLAGHNYEITLENGSIVSYEKKTEINTTYAIGNDMINERETVLLASLIDYLYPNTQIKTEDEHLSFNREQHKYKRYFKIYGAAVLAIIMVALFLSHFLLQHQVKELAEKESLMSLSNQSLVQLNTLKEERVLKEKVLMSSGVIDKNYAVRYFSDIGKSVPSTISLDLIKLKQPTRKIKPDEKISFHLNRIEIGGYTTSDSTFNTWVKDLKRIAWVKDLEITKYREDSKSENEFLIQITL